MRPALIQSKPSAGCAAACGRSRAWQLRAVDLDQPEPRSKADHPTTCPGCLRGVNLMRVLTVYAHHNPRSFCHAVLERFDAGLRDAGHANEVVDLHAIGFDPVLRDADQPNWIDDSVPDDVLTHMNVRQSLLESARNPLRRLMVKWWIGGLDERQIVRRLRRIGGPRDVLEQQARVVRADALAFVCPVYFVGFPAILKGWIERVFTLGFAFGLTPAGWRGDIGGRVPLLTHEKALIIQT